MTEGRALFRQHFQYHAWVAWLDILRPEICRAIRYSRYRRMEYRINERHPLDWSWSIRCRMKTKIIDDIVEGKYSRSIKEGDENE